MPVRNPRWLAARASRAHGADVDVTASYGGGWRMRTGRDGRWKAGGDVVGLEQPVHFRKHFACASKNVSAALELPWRTFSQSPRGPRTRAGRWPAARHTLRSTRCEPKRKWAAAIATAHSGGPSSPLGGERRILASIRRRSSTPLVTESAGSPLKHAADESPASRRLGRSTNPHFGVHPQPRLCRTPSGSRAARQVV
jgi:hypothetical protein